MIRHLLIASLLAWPAVAAAQPDESALPPEESAGPQSSAGAYRFDFGGDSAAEGFQAVSPEMMYSDERGFGLESADGVAVGSRDGDSSAAGDFLTSERPFYFSVRLPEGNYRVTLTLGGDQSSKTSVKAELRRLMLEGVETAAGESTTKTFLVNTRTPQIPGGGQVRLKDREQNQEWRAWDDRLTLEFDDARPTVSALEIEPVSDAPVLFIMGDSTVCDQPGEPYSSWGQMLTRFFQPNIVLANHAESGEAYRSSLDAGRFDKIFSQMKPGDFLIMQFGHNDMKSVDEASYANSIRRVVAACREKGGQPIIVSPMERRGFDANGVPTESLRGFPTAAQETAAELDVPFIDLHSMSKEFYAALGPENAPLAFAGFGARRDGTHHNNYGSYELAKCIVEGIRQVQPELAAHLIEGLPTFNPAEPDDLETFTFPASSRYTSLAPLGD